MYVLLSMIRWNIRMYVLLAIISGILECMYSCL